MDVDQDPLGQGTPLGTPFNDGLTPSTTRGTTTDPTGSVHTKNYFTPLYTESQATDHTNVNTEQQPTPAATRDAKMAVVEAAGEAEAEASAAIAAA